jgi:hypothetical protein
MPWRRETGDCRQDRRLAADGVFFLENVYEGRQTAGSCVVSITRGSFLRPCPTDQFHPGGMDRLSYVGTFTLLAFGTRPVEPDGSAQLSGTCVSPLFFVALDARGRSVNRC